MKYNMGKTDIRREANYFFNQIFMQNNQYLGCNEKDTPGDYETLQNYRFP